MYCITVNILPTVRDIMCIELQNTKNRENKGGDQVSATE